MARETIPTVDLQELAGGGSVDALRRAFGDFGLVYVRGHGLDPAELDAFYDDFLEVCSRPEAEKARLTTPEIWYQRGWTPPNTEKAVVAGGQPDFKECYFAAVGPLAPADRSLYPVLYADNVWPEGAASFRDRYLALGRRLQSVGTLLLRGAASALGLPPWTFEERVSGGPHVTRALRYLPLTEAQTSDDAILWGEEHTDFNLLTLLAGGRFFDSEGNPQTRPDDRAGLELRARPTADFPRGMKVRGTAPPGCLVAQVGQQLEILTGGTFLATPHVVHAPRTPGYSRTSVAHFIHLHSGQELFPLEPFRSEESVSLYRPPRLAGTYSLKTLVDIGLAPPEALNALGYPAYDRLASARAEEHEE